MKPILHEKQVSEVEVMNITKYGLWLLTRDSEIFVSFQGFPLFLDAAVSKIMKVELPTPNFLHWPDLGIDLAVQSVQRFPLRPSRSPVTTGSGR